MAFSVKQNHAQPLILSVLLLILLLPHNATAKSAHFTIYQQETFNKTVYLVSEGVQGNWDLVPMGAPFGSMVVYKEDLTTSQDPSSKVVGVADGISVFSRFDGSLALSSLRLSLETESYKGALSVVGGTHVTEPSDHTVVGGTGDFLFVQGLVTTTLVHAEGVSVTYKLDFHLFWPPYVTSTTAHDEL